MKNYLIIGGSGGIGSCLTGILADKGCRVYATYRKNKPDVCPVNVSYHYLDVLQQTYDFSWLPDKLDGLAYCPGSINLKPFSRVTPEDIHAETDLHITGAFRVMQAVMSRLHAVPGSSVVLFSTVAVQTGFKFHTLISSVKGAIEGLTRSLAAELAPVVRVNCIAPSLTETMLAAPLLNTQSKREANAARHPMQRIGKPEDIASMAAFLLSEDAGWITGQVFHIDGGIGSLKI